MDVPISSAYNIQLLFQKERNNERNEGGKKGRKKGKREEREKERKEERNEKRKNSMIRFFITITLHISCDLLF